MNLSIGHRDVKMSISSLISAILALSGGTLLVIAFLAGGAAILSLIERLQQGFGLLFADVELFGFVDSSPT